MELQPGIPQGKSSYGSTVREASRQASSTAFSSEPVEGRASAVRCTEAFNPIDSSVQNVGQNDFKKFPRAKYAKLAKAPPMPLLFTNLILASFAVFARDTVPSDLPFIPKFQITLASFFKGISTLSNQGRCAKHYTKRELARGGRTGRAL